MRIILGLWHPAHVHTFRNIIRELEKHDHDIEIVISDKDITKNLLDIYGLDYTIISESHSNILHKGIDLFKIEYRLLKISRKFHPDLFLGRGSAAMAHVSRLVKVPYIAFIDSEATGITGPLQIPFMDVVITPDAYERKLNPYRHIRVHTYKELAYLHPNQFTPDPSVVDALGICPDETFAIVRFVGYTAYHDVGQYGLSLEEKQTLVHELEKSCRVFISSEKELPSELVDFELKLPIDRIHDALSFASLFVTDSGTMATEAAILGTPTIRYSSYVGKNDMSNFKELESKYHLLINCNNFEDVLQRTKTILLNDTAKSQWKVNRNVLLREKIDLTAFMVWFIENYPDSLTEMRDHRDSQDRFTSPPEVCL